MKSEREQAIDSLILQLKDADPYIRKNAVDELALYKKDDRIVDNLLNVLNDDHPDVRSAAVLKLIAIRVPISLEKLITIFRTIPYTPATENLAHSSTLGSRMLSKIETIGGDQAEKLLTDEMKGRGQFCKVARNLLNSGRHENDHCLCPGCYSYLGTRKTLKETGDQVTDEMKRKAGRERISLLANFSYTCHECGSEVLV